MKVVKMYNETPKTLTAYDIPFNGISKEVPSGENVIIGSYDNTCDKFYMAMVKAGLRMSIENEITTEEKDSNATSTISSENKEMAPKKAPSKRSPKSKAKDGDNND